MKRIIAILCVCLLLTGCGTRYEDAKDTLKTVSGGYFTLIKEWDANDGSYCIVYANDTKVKYLIWRTSYKGGITPLYNADGSLQVYKEREEER
jgi:hypothetical protein